MSLYFLIHETLLIVAAFLFMCLGIGVINEPERERSWLRSLYSMASVIIGIACLTVAIRGALLGHAFDRVDDSKAVTIDAEVRDVLGDVLSRRFVDEASLDVLESWMNAEVLDAPIIRRTRTIDVSANPPFVVIQKIADGDAITDKDKVYLLEWLAFEIEDSMEPTVEPLIRSALIGEELNTNERKILAAWVADPTIGIRKVDDETYERIHRGVDLPAEPSDAVPPAPVEDPSA